jgi:hypothetical protein
VLARVISASSWWEVQQGISPYADGSYSLLPLPLLLSTYTALGRCLGPQCTDCDGGDEEGADGGGDTEGVEQVRNCSEWGSHQSRCTHLQ